MSADQGRPDELPPFRSPKRALARSFLLSRNRWKAKATQRLQQLKAARVRLRDLQISRDLWKRKALHLQQQLHSLQGLPTAASPDDTLAPPQHQPAAPPGCPAVPAAMPQQTTAPAAGPTASTPPDAPSSPTTPEPGAKKKRRRAGG
jgi:hypothetical protein